VWQAFGRLDTEHSGTDRVGWVQEKRRAAAWLKPGRKPARLVVCRSHIPADPDSIEASLTTTSRRNRGRLGQPAALRDRLALIDAPIILYVADATPSQG
jgi:hypothetical protein